MNYKLLDKYATQTYVIAAITIIAATAGMFFTYTAEDNTNPSIMDNNDDILDNTVEEIPLDFTEITVGEYIELTHGAETAVYKTANICITCNEISEE